MATAFAHRPKLSVSRPVDLDKALPSDEAMEAALLGTIIMDASWALSELRLTTPNLASRHFYKALHKKVFAGILELEEAGQAVDMLSLIGWLDDHGVAEAQAIVADLSAQIPMPAHPATYAQRVYDLARQRAQIQTSYKMWLAAWEGNTDEYNELTEKTTKLRDDFVPAKQRRLEVTSLREIMQTEYPEQRMLIEKLIQQGVVTLLAAKAKAGKSHLLQAAAYAIAEACQEAFASPGYHGLHCEQGDVLLMALEDTQRRIKNRGKKMRGDLPVPECIDVCTKAQRIDEGVIEQIDLYLDEHSNCKLVIIDTLTSILPLPGKNGGGYLDDRLNMEGLRKLAHDRDVAILPVIHCRKADGTDIFDTIQTTMGSQAGAENLIVLQRRRGEDRAILHVTGNDIEEESLAMKWNKETCTWSILGDADDVAENENEERIFGALEALGGEAKVSKIADYLKGEMPFSNIKTIMYRMAANGKLINTGGVFALGVPSTPKEEPTQQNAGFETLKPETFETLTPERDPEVAPVADEVSESQSFKVSEVSKSDFIGAETLIDDESLIPVSDFIEEALRKEALETWEKHDWCKVQVDGWPRGGDAFGAKQFIQNVNGFLLNCLLTALAMLGGA